MSASLTCLICDRDWPPTIEYAMCPCCREDTQPCDEIPLPDDEAQKLAVHGAFGWYLYDNDLI